MIPIHVLRETPFIQSLESEAREEGRKEGREVVVEMLLHAVGNRFPRLDIGSDIGRVRDIEALKKLFFELDRVSDEDALRHRVAELSQSAQS